MKNKLISSISDLAEAAANKYFGTDSVYGEYRTFLDAYKAGWAARGKADRDIAQTNDDLDTDEEIASLDEQD